MRIVNLKVLPNKKLICMNGTLLLGNKGDNGTTKLLIECDENLLQYNNFLILQNPSKEHLYCVPLLSLEFIVTSTICNEIGQWNITFLSTSQESIDEGIDYEQAIMVSDNITGIVRDSVIDDSELETLPIDTNMEILYNDLMTLRKDLNTLIEDNPNIEDYVEVQEMLNEILYKLDHVQIDTSGLVVEVDLSETNEKIDNVQSDITTTKSMIQGMNSMIQMGIMSTLSNINNNTQMDYEHGVDTLARVKELQETVGNIETRPSGTLSDLCYWGANMSNGARINTETIITLLTDANTIADEILTTLEG